MGQRLRKRTEDLIIEGRLWLEGRLDGRRRHYYSVYLWSSRGAMVDDGLPTNESEGFFKDAAAACCHLPLRSRISADGAETHVDRPKIGELHFVSGDWDFEIVVHELTHAAFQFARVEGPEFDDIRRQEGDAEEMFCYRLGEWSQCLYGWLGASDPALDCA